MVVATHRATVAKQLIGDTEQRPQGIDSAQRIFDSLPQEISPARNDERAGRQNGGIPTGAAQRLPHMSQGVLHHEAAHAGAGVEHGENEQRFKHDGEVVPDRHQRLSAQAVGKDMRHADGEGGRASGAVVESLLAYGLCQSMHFGGGDGKSPRLMVAAAASGAWPTIPAGLLMAK